MAHLDGLVCHLLAVLASIKPPPRLPASPEAANQEGQLGAMWTLWLGNKKGAETTSLSLSGLGG